MAVTKALLSHKTLVDAITISSNPQIGVVTYVIVLTDGEDTASKEKSMLSTMLLLQMANYVRDFKVILAGVGLEHDARKCLSTFGNIGDRDISFRDLKSADDIKDMFDHVSLSFREVREVGVVLPSLRSSSPSPSIIELKDSQSIISPISSLSPEVDSSSASACTLRPSIPTLDTILFQGTGEGVSSKYIV